MNIAPANNKKRGGFISAPRNTMHHPHAQDAPRMTSDIDPLPRGGGETDALNLLYCSYIITSRAELVKRFRPKIILFFARSGAYSLRLGLSRHKILILCPLFLLRCDDKCSNII